MSKHGFCGSLKSRRRLHAVPQDGTCNVCQDILRNALHGANRVAFNVANFAASDVASRDYHLVAKSVPAVLPTGKNLLLGWRHWPVGAASEPLRLRVAGERRWPSLFASALLRRAAHRDCLPLVTTPRQSRLCSHVFGAFPGFRLSLNSLASSALIILTLAMCGPRERYGEVSIGGGVTLSAGAAVGAGFVATVGAF